jgi:hypothetical protein
VFGSNEGSRLRPQFIRQDSEKCGLSRPLSPMTPVQPGAQVKLMA